MYRYGYNGIETDPEVKEGWGQHYTTYFRQYDPRLGRWWSNDPVVQAGESPYAAMYNNPMFFADPSGAVGEGRGTVETPDEYVEPPPLGCPECDINRPSPSIGQRYITQSGWMYQYLGFAWALDVPTDKVTVTTSKPEAWPGTHRLHEFNTFVGARDEARMRDNPVNMPGEYFHGGQWIPAAEYVALVRRVVDNIDNPDYDPLADGFYFGDGSRLQEPFFRLYVKLGERRWGTSNENLPSGAANPFAHKGLETPAFAPEALLGGLAGLGRGAVGRGVGGAMARGTVSEVDDVFGGMAASGGAAGTDNLAFGLSDDLYNFASSTGYKTYRQFTSGGLNTSEISLAIQNSSNNLHFNLTGFSLRRYRAFDPSSPLTIGNITNWELNTIYSASGALERTTFYRFFDGSYQIVPKPF